MKVAIEIPKLGLTMEEATVVQWHFEDGQRVAKGDAIVSIETDKIVADVEAEQDGFLQRLVTTDTLLPVGALVGYLHPTAQAAQAAGAGPGAAAAPAELVVNPSLAAATAGAPSTPHPAVLTATAATASGRLLVSPVARTLANADHIVLDRLTGSGPGGVILKRDVEAAVAADAAADAVRAAVPGAASPPGGRPVPATAVAAAAPHAAQRKPLTGMRRAISERMMNSLASTAQMTGFAKVDMAEAVQLRAALVAVADHIGARITYTDLVLKAAATVLAQMPGINSSIDGQDVVTWSDVNIGLAVALEGGLVVPVLRNVDRLSLVEISLLRAAMIDKARTGKLTLEDVDGGTFTVSNFGSYGGEFETPILNTPQSALLGIGQIADEAVVRDKQIVIRPMMSISLTFDHRLIDGAVAGEFRRRFKACLEQPTLPKPPNPPHPPHPPHPPSPPSPPSPGRVA